MIAGPEREKPRNSGLFLRVSDGIRTRDRRDHNLGDPGAVQADSAL